MSQLEIRTKCDHCESPGNSTVVNQDDQEFWLIKCPSCDHSVHYFCFFNHFPHGGHSCVKCGFASLKGGGDWKIMSGSGGKKTAAWWNLKNVFGQSHQNPPIKEKDKDKDSNANATGTEGEIGGNECEYCRFYKISKLPRKNIHFFTNIIGQKSSSSTNDLIRLNTCDHLYHLNCLKSHLQSDKKQGCIQCGAKIESGQWRNLKSVIHNIETDSLESRRSSKAAAQSTNTNLEGDVINSLEISEKIFDPFYCRLCPLYRKPKVVPAEISKNQETMMDALFPWVKLNACPHFYHEACLQLYLMAGRSQCMACSSTIDMGQCEPYSRRQLMKEEPGQ